MLNGYIIHTSTKNKNGKRYPQIHTVYARSETEALEQIVGGRNRKPIKERLKSLETIVEKIKVVKIIGTAKITFSNGEKTNTKNIILANGILTYGYHRFQVYKVSRRNNQIKCYFKRRSRRQENLWYKDFLTIDIIKDTPDEQQNLEEGH